MLTLSLYLAFGKMGLLNSILLILCVFRRRVALIKEPVKEPIDKPVKEPVEEPVKEPFMEPVKV